MALSALFASRVKPLPKPKRYRDGQNGLSLVVQPSGSKSWTQRLTIDGVRTDRGLGKYPAVSLSEARKRARANMAAVDKRQDPWADRRRPAVPTFAELLEKYIPLRPDLAPRTARDWLSCLARYTGGFAHKPVDRVTPADVLEALSPIWTTKPHIATKVRVRTRSVFTYAIAARHIGSNPAGEAIEALLPRRGGHKRHYRALPYGEVGAALKTIEASSASLSARLCLAFLILTAARSGEARGATWDEIGLHAATWTIPAERMKASDEHRVPLSTQALDVLAEVRPLRDDSNLVFPSVKPGRKLSDMTLTAILRRCGLASEATVHGFRSSFRTWCQDADVPSDVAETALAHKVGNSVQQAYARSKLFDQRRPVMQRWADYVLPPAD